MQYIKAYPFFVPPTTEIVQLYVGTREKEKPDKTVRLHDLLLVLKEADIPTGSPKHRTNIVVEYNDW